MSEYFLLLEDKQTHTHTHQFPFLEASRSVGSSLVASEFCTCTEHVHHCPLLRWLRRHGVQPFRENFPENPSRWGCYRVGVVLNAVVLVVFF